MSVAAWSGALLSWEAELARIKKRIGAAFGRRGPREMAWKYLDGLLSGIERKTGWQLAERAGEDHPWRVQGVLGRDRWDADAMRDVVRDHQDRRAGRCAGQSGPLPSAARPAPWQHRR